MFFGTKYLEAIGFLLLKIPNLNDLHPQTVYYEWSLIIHNLDKLYTYTYVEIVHASRHGKWIYNQPIHFEHKTLTITLLWQHLENIPVGQHLWHHYWITVLLKTILFCYDNQPFFPCSVWTGTKCWQIFPWISKQRNISRIRFI